MLSYVATSTSSSCVALSVKTRDISGSLPSQRRHHAIHKTAGAEGEDHVRDAEGNRVDGNDPHHRERALHWTKDQRHAERNRDEPREDEPALSGSLLTQPNRGDDLEHAHRDRPDADKEEQGECGE